MPGKDFGIYRQAASGLSITSVGRRLKWDTTQQEEGATTINVATDEVQLEETRRYLVIFGTGAVQNGTGDCTISLKLQQNTVNVPGGVAYGNFSDVDGVDTCDILGVGIVDGTAGDMMRVIVKAVGGTATEQANKGHIQFIALPSSFDVAIKTDSVSRTGSNGGMTDKVWDTSALLDSNYTLSGNTGLVPATSGRYLILASTVTSVDAALSGDSEGASARIRTLIDGTIVAHSGGRAVMLHRAPDRSKCSVLSMLPMDLTAGQVVKIQLGYEGLIESTDVLQSEAEGSVFALIKIDELTRTADAFKVRKGAHTTTPSSKTPIDWTLENEIDAGYTHSNSTNPSRITVPAGKFLSFSNLSIDRQTSGNANDMAWSATFMRNGAVDIPYGDGGSQTNLGYNSSTLQDSSDIALAFISDTVSSGYFEVSIEPTGTATDTTAQVRGFGAAFSSVWWGVMVEDWPDDGIVLTPSTVEALGDVLDSSLAMGALAATADTVEALSGPQDASLGLGALGVAPDVTGAVGDDPLPAISLGGLGVEATPTEALANHAQAAFGLGELSLQASLVTSVADFLDSSLSLGALVVTPGEVSALGDALSVAISLGGAFVGVEPMSVGAGADFADALVGLGALGVAPGEISALADVPSMVLGMGAMAVVPGLVVASAFIPEHSLALVLQVAPSVIGSASDVIDAEYGMGVMAFAPGTVEALADLPSGVVALGSISFSPLVAAGASDFLSAPISLLLTVQPDSVAGSSGATLPAIALGILTVLPDVATAATDLPSMVLTLPGMADFYAMTAQAVRDRWISAVQGPLSLATHFEAMPPVKPSGLYAFIAVVFDEAQVLDVGPKTRIEQAGHLEVTLRAPAYLGMQDLTRAADSIKTAFSDLTLSNVRYQLPREVSRTRGGVRMELKLSCPFLAENSSTASQSVEIPIDLDLESIGKIVRDIYIAEVSDVLSLPTQFDNVPFSRPDNAEWARLRVIPSGSVPVDGVTIRTPGLAIIQVLTPATTGDKPGTLILDQVNRAFRNRDAQGLIFGAPEPGAAKRHGAWFIRNITIPWSADSDD